MKQLKLIALDLEDVEILQREHLKNTFGGSDSPGEGCPRCGFPYWPPNEWVACVKTSTSSCVCPIAGVPGCN